MMFRINCIVLSAFLALPVLAQHRGGGGGGGGGMRGGGGGISSGGMRGGGGVEGAKYLYNEVLAAL